MRNILLILFIVSVNSYASFGEMFGADAITASLGNQSDASPNNPANNFYNPALLGFSDKLQLSVGAAFVSTDFTKINNVQIRNALTHNNDNQVGEIDTNYEEQSFFTIHLVVPLLSRKGPKLGLSILTPALKLIETNTGDPFLTEYVMYRSRYDRTSVYVNLAYAINESYSFSLGALTGLQVSARTYTRASLNDPTEDTYGRAKTRGKPSVTPIASATFKSDRLVAYVYAQGEMQSKFQALAAGETSNPAVPFDIELNSTMFYDPATFRIGTSLLFDNVDLHATLEYQLWDTYQAPTLRIVKKSGAIRGSNTFEQVIADNIFIPKLGLTYRFSDNFHFRFGALYRPTPLQGDFSGAGNTVDTDVIMLSAGSGFDFDLWGSNIELTLAGQYHMLEERDVLKTENLENGSTGNKIGYPGYDIGGKVLAVQGSMKFNF